MKVARAIFGLAGVVIVTVIASSTLVAADYGGGSVQGYGAERALDNGTIVTLSDKDSRQVEVAEQSNEQNIFGVTVDRKQVPLTVSNDKLKNEVYIAVSGTYNVLVSDQNGSIVAGDYITLSSVDGIGMKAETKQKTVLGRAAGSFDGKNSNLGKTTLKDASGKDHQTVKFGLIPVTINVQRNPNIKSTKSELPDFLQRLGQEVAQKQVSPVRIYLSMAITATSIITAIVMLYVGVRTGVISIGRNPLSKKSIFRALLETILTSLLILIIGLFAVYLLLRL